MADEAALQAKIDELEEKVKALTTLVGQSGGSIGRLNMATDKLLGPFSALLDATSSGATGLSVYNNFLDKNADLVNKVFADLGPFGDALKAMTGLSSGYIKMVSMQNDALYKSYQGLSSIGAAGEANLDNVMNMAKQFGITNAQELPKFNQLLAENAQGLAKFGGTVAQGVKQFGDVAAGIQQSGIQTEFMNMGMSVDTINKGMAGYLKIQNLTGSAQKMTTDQLTAGAANYIRELDVLTKLTGKSAEAQIKEEEDRLNDERYAIHYRELKMKADAGDLEAAKQLAEEDKVLKQTTGTVQKGFQAMYTGFGMQTEAGLKLFMAAPKAAMMAAKGIGTDANQILDTAKGEATKSLNTYGGLYKAAGNDLTSNVKDLMNLEGMKGKAADREKEARTQQETQIKSTNETVAAMTATIQMQRQATLSLTNMLQTGGLAVSYFGMKIAEAQQAQAGKLPGAVQTPEQMARQGMTETEILKQLERQKEQLRTQGVGGTPETPPEERGVHPTEYQIQRRALQEMNQMLPEIKKFTESTIKDLTDAAGKAVGDSAKAAAEAILEQYKKALEKLPLQISAVPTFQSQSFAATVDRGIINVASVNGVGFPNMQTRFTGSLDNVDAKQLVASNASEFAANGKTKEAPDSEMILASNAELAGKMDELIGLMRTSNGYQQKISQQVYA